MDQPQERHEENRDQREKPVFLKGLVVYPKPSNEQTHVHTLRGEEAVKK